MLAARRCVAWLAAVVVVSRGYRLEVADCVKYGKCSDPDLAVLQGHDVVEAFNMKDHDEPVLGSDEYQATAQGYQFWFKNQENVRIFLANQSKYLPQCGGFCAYAVSCHGGEGVCHNNAPVAINSSAGYAIYKDRLYLFNNGAKRHAMSNSSTLDQAVRKWDLWYPENNHFNTDAFFPFKDGDGQSACRSCGFEYGSSEANIIARDRKFYLGKSGAIRGMSTSHVLQFPHAIKTFHSERGTVGDANTQSAPWGGGMGGGIPGVRGGGIPGVRGGMRGIPGVR